MIWGLAGIRGLNTNALQSLTSEHRMPMSPFHTRDLD
jgi:hypothetical protein